MDKETILVIAAIATPLLSLIGSMIGSARRTESHQKWLESHDDRLEAHDERLGELGRRSHRHAGILTLVASRTDVDYQGDD